VLINFTTGVLGRESRGRGDGVVLTATAAADPDGADDRSVTPQRNTASEDHDSPVVGYMDPKELLARLAVFGELRRRNVECARRKRLVDGDVDTADPRAVHPNMAHQIPADIDARRVMAAAEIGQPMNIAVVAKAA
jgi:hypothetical protein